ncbi:hypothetical protein ES705_00638 [subsurface metagenome]|nr:hypothetical protein [Clostridia bacterium]
MSIYNRQINQEQQAFFAWGILIDYAKQRKKITYKELTAKMGVHYRASRYFLEVIQSYCMQQKYPPLTILAISTSTGMPGSGFIAWDRDDLESGYESVFNFNWKALENPFRYAKSGTTIKILSNQLISKTISKEELFVKVKARGQLQNIFRTSILEIYEYKCAFCGFSIIEALEAVHIKPWEKCTRNEKLDITNGILLCSIHHKLFDKKILTISDDYKIMGEKRRFLANKYNRYFTSDLIGMKLALPNLLDYYPSIKYIQNHRKK